MRPTIDQYLMRLACVAAERTTCAKRAVGCVLADATGRVLSIGYNGVAAGLPHCAEGHLCADYDLPAGQDSCEAIHAEQNALIQCRDLDTLATAYVTLSPCKPCLKLLLGTKCQRIVFKVEHTDEWAKQQWQKAGRIWEQLAA